MYALVYVGERFAVRKSGANDFDKLNPSARIGTVMEWSIARHAAAVAPEMVLRIENRL
jgi:hypothetical protein